MLAVISNKNDLNKEKKDRKFNKKLYKHNIQLFDVSAKRKKDIKKAVDLILQ